MNLPRDRSGTGSAKEWLNHAGSDLRLAELAAKNDVLPGQVCFHAQQAVEKAFKSVLLHHHVEFPFTHDLEKLVAVFEEAGIPLPQDLQEAGSLTPYAVESRYPGYWGEITGADVTDAVEFAARAVAWAQNQV